MATFNLTDAFKEDIGKNMDLESDTLKWVLTTVAPTASTTVYGDLSGEVANGNGYTTGGLALDSVTYTQTSGTATLTAADEVITASAGAMGAFRYAALIDDTVASPAKPVIGWLDYGSELTLASGESLTIDIGASGILQVA